MVEEEDPVVAEEEEHGHHGPGHRTPLPQIPDTLGQSDLGVTLRLLFLHDLFVDVLSACRHLKVKSNR